MFNIAQSLAATESGNNPNAYRVNKDGRDMTGKYQFSRGRLKDLGMGELFTYDQFKNNPALQEEIFNKHIADIDTFIDNKGLDRFIGTDINGVEMTRSGMQAMAHLGGKGGLERFLISSGGYNPQDELGTSLLDYATRHGGVTGPRVSVPNEGSMTHSAIASRKPDPSGSLMDFAKDMQNASGEVGTHLRHLGEGQDMMHNIFAAQLANTNPRDMSAALGASADRTKARAKNSLQQTFGKGLTADAKDLLPPSPNEVVTMSTNSGGGVGGSGVVNAEEEEPQRGFMLNMLNNLMPNAKDDETRRQAAGDMLAALSIGLGQMSAGQAVDVSPVFKRIAARNQSLAQAKVDERKAAIDAVRAQNEQKRIALDSAKLDLDTAKYYNSMDGYSMSPEQLEMLSQDPVYAPLVSGLASPDVETRKQSMDAITDLRKEQGKALIKAAENQSPAMGQLGRVLDNSDASFEEIMTAADNANIGPNELSSMMNAFKTKPPSEEQFAEAYLNAIRAGEQEKADLMLEMATMRSPTGGTQRMASNIRYAEDRQDELISAVADNRMTAPQIAQIKRATLAQANNEDVDDKGMFAGAFQTAYKALRAVDPETADNMARELNFDPQNAETLDNATALLALQIARPMMKGQGTVTEGERRALLTTIASADQNPEVRLEVINKLEALNEIDRIALESYSGTLSADDGYDNARTNYGNMQAELSVISSQITEAAQLATKFQQRSALDNFKKQTEGMTLRDMYDETTVSMTQQQFGTYKNALPTIRGVKHWTKISPNGEYIDMVYDPKTGKSVAYNEHFGG